jgi:hypothetical protein
MCVIGGVHQYLPLLCLLLSSAGCLSLSGPRPIEGQWTGSVVEISVKNGRGDSFPAAVLELESGPTLVLPAEYGAGHSPILVKLQSGNCRIIDPTQLPINKRVLVTGKMVIAHATKPFDAPPSGDSTVTRGPRPRDDEATEHLLILEKWKQL